MVTTTVAIGASAQTTMPLWPGGAPGEKNVPAGEVERDTTGPKDGLIAGKSVERLGFVSTPMLTLYRPNADTANGAAVVVLPGGAYKILAYDLEGTEVCTWLNSIGVTCALVKYRVPDAGPYPLHTQDLADAQRAVRMVRAHAGEWGVDAKRVGVLGFSAGAHLAAVLGAHFDGGSDAHSDEGAEGAGVAGESTQAAKPAGPTGATKPPDARGAGDAGAAADITDQLSARPDFTLLIYPAYLVQKGDDRSLAPEVQPAPLTPPTFLLQAEDDPIKVENSLVYYAALKEAKVSAEMHLYANGGHGFGLRQTKLPVTHWPELAATWLHTLGVTP